MNRVEFLAELERLLSGMPEEERQAAVQYYADYFADAGEENEQEVIRELGSPEKVAGSIKADYYGTEYNEEKFNRKNYMEKYGQRSSGGTDSTRADSAAGTGQSLLLMDVTPLSLSIETVGGVSTCLIRRNSTIPTRYSKVFTTAAPYQTSVDIHVLQGERPMARDNKTIGKFRLKGIRKAMAGVPQIEVTFDIDVNGILKVSARDLDTGKAQSITITADDRMSDMEIEQAIHDAQEYAGQDQLRRDALELIGEAQKTAAQARQILKVQDKQMEKGRKKQLKKNVSALEKVLAKTRVDKVSETDMDNIRQTMHVLEEDINAAN